VLLLFFFFFKTVHWNFSAICYSFVQRSRLTSTQIP
jgi:hypothetical protein